MDPSLQFEPWYHGATSSNAEDLLKHGVRDEFKSPHSAVAGPGLYITNDPWTAFGYAGRSGRVVVGSLHPENPISIEHGELADRGAFFRKQHPEYGGAADNTFLGNLSLRKEGHDFLHLLRGERSSGQGVVLKRSAFTPQLIYPNP